MYFMKQFKRGEQILIIDDDESSRFLTRKILEGAGYGVSESESVITGLEKALRDSPHLILLDLIMSNIYTKNA